MAKISCQIILIAVIATKISAQLNELIDKFNCIPVFKSDGIYVNIYKPYLVHKSQNLLPFIKSFRHDRLCFIGTGEDIVDKRDSHFQKRPFNIISNKINFNFSSQTPIQTTYVKKFSTNIWSIEIKCESKILKVVNKIDEVLCPPEVEGKTLNVAVIGYAPYLIRTSNKDLTGTDIEIVKVLGEKMGFNIDVTEFSDWGGPANKQATKWTGVIGSVQKDVSQIGTGQLFMSVTVDINKKDAYWISAVDMIYVYHIDTKFITTKPQKLSPLTNIIKPFTFNMWITILIAFVLSSIFYVVITGKEEKFEHFSTIFRFQIRESHHRMSNIYSANLAPNIYLGCWLIYATFITFCYECNLRAYLFSVDYEPTIYSAKDIVGS